MGRIQAALGAMVVGAVSLTGTALVGATAEAASKPVVTSLSVHVGPQQGGTRVTIRGRNLAGATKVTFGGVAGKQLAVSSSTTLKVNAPAHAPGTVAVRVVTRAGTSALVAADRFHYYGLARATMPLPRDAATVPKTATPHVGCWAAGKCAAVGFYTATSGDEFGALWTLTGRTWSVVKAPLPSDAADNPAPRPQAITCASAGFCVAHGTYTAHVAGANRNSSVMWTRAAGTWTAQHLPVPPAATPGFVNIDRIACAASLCAAAGNYSTAGSGGTALWSRAAGGAWAVTAAPLPGDALANLSPDVYGLACDASGFCIAGGAYFPSGNKDAGALWVLSAGTWSVSKAPLPSDATEAPKAPTVGLPAACGGATCVAVLQVTVPGGTRHAVWVRRGGAWTAPTLPLPSGADGTGPDVTAAACSTSGRCVVAGRYLDSSGNTQGALWSRSAAASWAVTRAPVPSDTASNPRTTIARMSCTAGGTCLADGGYTYHLGGTDGNFDSIAWTLGTGTTWSLVKPFSVRAAEQHVMGEACSSSACLLAGFATINNSTRVHLWTLTHGVWRSYLPTVPGGTGASANLEVACGSTGGCAATGYYGVPGGTAPASWVYVA